MAAGLAWPEPARHPGHPGLRRGQLWGDLPKKDRDWILYTGEQPTVPVYAGFTPAETRAALRRKTEPSYQGTFTGARKYVLHTFATTQSALMKKRVSRFMTGGICPVCKGKRLKREALSVTFAGVDIGTLAELPLADNEALLLALQQLKRAGNSIFVVEHDLEVMHRADWLVDVGPDAGEQGGRILYSGPPAGLKAVKASHTARYLFAEGAAPRRRSREAAGWLELRGLMRNNLQGLDVRFPLGTFTVVTGVSGSASRA